MTSKKSIKIGIIGGSIAGCTIGMLLKRQGYHVEIFEKSKGTLEERGGGIIIPIELYQNLIKAKVLPSKLLHFEIASRSFFDFEREIWQQPIIGASLRWGGLFQALYQNLPSDIYKPNIKVTKIEPHQDKVTLTFNKTEKKTFDYVICTDGVYSLGRHQLFPKTKLSYTGYIAWRGCIPAEQADAQQSQKEIHYHCFPGGHYVAYHIPSKQHKNGLLNWLIYIKQNMPLNQQALHTTNVQDLSQLNKFCQKHIPANIAHLIQQTKNAYRQNIYEYNAPSIQQNNILLLGDSACVLRPHTASGATKALKSGLTLSKAFETTSNLNDALATWAINEATQNQAQFKLSQRVGHALVTNTPPWEKLSHQEMDKWWQSLIADSSWYMNDTK